MVYVFNERGDHRDDDVGVTFPSDDGTLNLPLFQGLMFHSENGVLHEGAPRFQGLIVPFEYVALDDNQYLFQGLMVPFEYVDLDESPYQLQWLMVPFEYIAWNDEPNQHEGVMHLSQELVPISVFEHRAWHELRHNVNFGSSILSPLFNMVDSDMPDSDEGIEYWDELNLHSEGSQNGGVEKDLKETLSGKSKKRGREEDDEEEKSTRCLRFDFDCALWNTQNQHVGGADKELNQPGVEVMDEPQPGASCEVADEDEDKNRSKRN